MRPSSVESFVDRAVLSHGWRVAIVPDDEEESVGESVARELGRQLEAEGEERLQTVEVTELRAKVPEASEGTLLVKGIEHASPRLLQELEWDRDRFTNGPRVVFVTTMRGLAALRSQPNIWSWISSSVDFLASDTREMIGGRDVVIPGTPWPEDTRAILRYLVWIWPDGRFANAATDEPSIALSAALRLSSVPEEFLVYANADAELSWDTEGRTEGTDELLVHVLVDDEAITCVVADTLTGLRMAHEIQGAVQSARGAEAIELAPGSRKEAA